MIFEKKFKDFNEDLPHNARFEEKERKEEKRVNLGGLKTNDRPFRNAGSGNEIRNSRKFEAGVRESFKFVEFLSENVQQHCFDFETSKKLFKSKNS